MAQDVPDWTQSVNVANATIDVAGPVTIEEGQQGTALLAQGIDVAVRLYQLSIANGADSVSQNVTLPVSATGLAVTASTSAAFAVSLIVTVRGGTGPVTLATGPVGLGGVGTVLVPIPGTDAGNLNVQITSSSANFTGVSQPVAYVSAMMPPNTPTAALRSVAISKGVTSNTTTHLVAAVAGETVTVWDLDLGVQIVSATVGFYNALLQSSATSVPVAELQLYQATAVGISGPPLAKSFPTGFALPAGEGLDLVQQTSAATPSWNAFGSVQYTQV